MSYQMLNIAGDLLFKVFGNGLIFTTFIVLFVIVILFIMRANLPTILIVLLPLLLAITLGNQTTNIVALPPWVFYALGLPLAMAVGVAFFALIRR